MGTVAPRRGETPANAPPVWRTSDVRQSQGRTRSGLSFAGRIPWFPGASRDRKRVDVHARGGPRRARRLAAGREFRDHQGLAAARGRTGEETTMAEFRGSYTVMVTPFREDGRGIDEAATRRFVDWQIRRRRAGPHSRSGAPASSSPSPATNAPGSSRSSSIRRGDASPSSPAPPRSGRTSPCATAGRRSASAPTG